VLADVGAWRHNKLINVAPPPPADVISAFSSAPTSLYQARSDVTGTDESGRSLTPQTIQDIFAISRRQNDNHPQAKTAGVIGHAS